MNEHVKRAIDAVGGSGSALASAIERSPQFISQLLKGDRQVPAELCPVIERATAGQVRCEDLRPDIPWSVLRESVELPTPDRFLPDCLPAVQVTKLPALDGTPSERAAAACDRRRISMWTVPGGRRESDPGVLPERKTTDVPRGTKPTQRDVDSYVIGATARKPARRASTERPGGKREERG
jgi:DNA-binding transcriptional regulator YdaS (Cro superfamily)